jgi:hypothetical protein
MTMIDGKATLVISSHTHMASDVTRALGILPDWSAERGDERVRDDGTSVSLRRRYFESAMWALEVDASPATMMAVDEDAAKGFGTLYVLVDRLLGRGPSLAMLRDNDYAMYIRWYGTSGSAQGGFLLPKDLLRDIAELGCDFFGNVYPFEGERGRGLRGLRAINA